jgi:hypothetical protein
LVFDLQVAVGFLDGPDVFGGILGLCRGTLGEERQDHEGQPGRDERTYPGEGRVIMKHKMDAFKLAKGWSLNQVAK